MDRRERVKRALHFNKPDRVPIEVFHFDSDFFPIYPYEPISWQPINYPPHVDGGAFRIENHAFRRDVYNWNDDIRKKLGFSEAWWEQKHESIDEFGVIWRSSGTKGADKTMGHPIKGPFEDDEAGVGWDNIDDFTFPDGANPERYKVIKSGKWKTMAEDRYLIGSFGSGGLFSRCSYMRGFTAFLIDLARNKNPNRIQQLIDSVLSYFLKVIENLKENCQPLDSIIISDDMGTQHNTFISPRIFKKFFKEPYKKITNLIHDLGMDFILHSCGDIGALLPEFVDIGINAMEFDSPHMTGVENFKRFAKERKIAFCLSSNIQSTYLYGTPVEIEEEIKYYIKEIGNNEGGLVLWEYPDNYSIGTPKRNIRAQRKAALKWGKYNENGVIEWLA